MAKNILTTAVFICDSILIDLTVIHFGINFSLLQLVLVMCVAHKTPLYFTIIQIIFAGPL